MFEMLPDVGVVATDAAGGSIQRLASGTAATTTQQESRGLGSVWFLQRQLPLDVAPILRWELSVLESFRRFSRNRVGNDLAFRRAGTWCRVNATNSLIAC